MPYIITIRTFSDSGVQTIWDYTRRAVATLDDDAIYGLLNRDEINVSDEVHYMRLFNELQDIADVGHGTVGPLPDGTVIEVERVDRPAWARDDAFEGRR